MSDTASNLFIISPPAAPLLVPFAFPLVVRCAAVAMEPGTLARECRTDARATVVRGKGSGS